MSKQSKKLEEKYEKKIFDLEQLIEISLSLNSTLDYYILMDSILYTVMGQMQVLEIGLFVKKAIDHNYFTLSRNCKGFDIKNSNDFIISENSTLVNYFLSHQQCLEKREFETVMGKTIEMGLIEKMDPILIIPMIAKGHVNGIIVLGDRINGMAFDEGEKGYLMILAQFAANAVHNALLFEMTTTDMMTQLRLKHFFFTSIIEHIDHNRNDGIPFSIIMMDIDNFKRLNDTYGHPFGDIVLKRLASIVKDKIRQVDIAARYGGEEFVVLLPGATVDEAETVAERIRTTIEEVCFTSNMSEVFVTVSLGVAQYDMETDSDSDSLINRADKALYRSKHNGKNRTTVAVVSAADPA